RVQRPAAEREGGGVAVVARRKGEHLDAVLALPCDFERATQHQVAPPLRHADRDLEAAGGERAELPPVGRRDVRVGNDEDAVHRASSPLYLFPLRALSSGG